MIDGRDWNEWSFEETHFVMGQNRNRNHCGRLEETRILVSKKRPLEKHKLVRLHTGQMQCVQTHFHKCSPTTWALTTWKGSKKQKQRVAGRVERDWVQTQQHDQQ